MVIDMSEHRMFFIEYLWEKPYLKRYYQINVKDPFVGYGRDDNDDDVIMLDMIAGRRQPIHVVREAKIYEFKPKSNKSTCSL